jgi:glucokinase
MHEFYSNEIRAFVALTLSNCRNEEMKKNEIVIMKNSSVIGVDLGGTKVQTGLVDRCELKQIYTKEINALGSEEDVLHEIFQILDKYDDEHFSGIGFGIPSVVDVEAGVIYDVQNIPSWKEVHLKEILEKRYNVPVNVNNDANVFTVGEKYFGCAKDYKNVVGITLGTGLGGGIIINEKLYNGKNCGAGEFGEMSYQESKLEDYCASQFFIRNYNVSGQELFELAERGEDFALRAFTEFGFHIGNALKIVVLAVDPEIIVFGGSISKSYKFFKDSMIKQLRTLAFTKSVERLIIKVSDTENVALLGAAALCFE